MFGDNAIATIDRRKGAVAANPERSKKKTIIIKVDRAREFME